MSEHSIYCAANACPCSGTQSRSTTGSTEWWCAHHFGSAPSRIHEVTAELRRLAWLVQLCKCIRDHINTGCWTEQHQAAYKEISLNQRSDLNLGGPDGTKNESYPQWLLRLEGVLASACKPAAAAPETQQSIDV